MLNDEEPSWASASVVQLIPRLVSLARAAISSWVSVHDCCGQSASVQRQTRLSHTIDTDIPNHGASAACTRRCP